MRPDDFSAQGTTYFQQTGLLVWERSIWSIYQIDERHIQLLNDDLSPAKLV